MLSRDNSPVSKYLPTGVLLLVILALAGSGFREVAGQDSPREWTDSTGRFKVTGSLIQVEDGYAVLRNADGKNLRIPVSRLSKADQDYLAAGDNPFEMIDGSGSGPTTSPPSSDAISSTASSSSSALGWSQPSVPDWDQAELLTIMAAVPWNVPESSNRLTFDAKPVALGPKSNFHEGLQSVAVNPACRRAVIGYTVSFTVPQPLSRITLIDLDSGKAVMSDQVEADMRPRALLDSGNDVLMVGNSDGRRGNGETKDQLQIWRVQNKSVSRTPSWVPYPDDKKSFGKTQNASVVQAVPVNDNKLVTVSDKGHLVLWNIATRQPIWHARLNDRNFAFDVSTDRQRLAVVNDRVIAVLETETGKVLGSSSLEKGKTVGWARVRWSPDGSQLLFTSLGDVRVLDVKTGEWVYDFSLTKSPVAPRALSYPSRDYALLDNSLLVHLPSRIQVCQYTGAAAIRSLGGISFIAVQGGNNGVFVSSNFPHPAAEEMLKNAQSDPTMFLIHPGVEVSVDVSGINGKYREQVKQGLEKAVTQSGYKLSAGAPIKAVASVSGPKQEAVSYIAAGSYIVNKYQSTVKLQWQGKDLWTRGSSNVPGILSTKRGQTMQEALDEAGKKPNLSIFASVRFPEFMQKPSDNAAQAGNALMKSNFTTQGLVDSK